MVMAAIYARVSSTRQKQDHTIASQTAAIRAFAERQGLDVCDEWIFEDEGHSGATLVRPALDRLRDLIAQVPVEMVLVHAPDRLARRYAYQALLVEEFARAGTEVRFVNAPAGDSPEDRLLVQFQGMIAEYECAQIAERTRRGKLHRARAGSVNVLGGAPYGYRYVRKSDDADARYDVVEHQGVVVREIFTRYVDGGDSIAGLCRWLETQGIPTATGKARWDRSTVWGMLRNPAYAGRAGFGKTAQNHDSRPAATRSTRLAGKAQATNPVTVDRDPDQWIHIPVPALIDETTFERAARRLDDNKRFAARNSTTPSLLKGLVACRNCSYAHYRTSTTTTKRKIVYYRCIGSDGWRHPGGKICDARPIRADQLEPAVWEHVTRLLSDPELIRVELDQRLTQLRATNPVTAQRTRLERDLARTTTAIARLVEAYQEQLLTLDELRARMPELRKRETTVGAQLDALDAQLIDHETYLKLAENLDTFLARLRESTDSADTADRQRVLRAVIREVLVSPDGITIRHSIPTTPGGSGDASRHNGGGSDGNDDAAPHPSPDCLLRGRTRLTVARQRLPAPRVRPLGPLVASDAGPR
jgi:site-specific DNA recombinase